MNPRRTSKLLIALAVTAVTGGAASCGGSGTSSTASTSTAPVPTTAPAPSSAAPGAALIDPGDGGNYRPSITASDFVATIDNPYLPLAPGARWVYEGTADGQHERVEVEVTGEVRTVMGVSATILHDVVRHDGEVVEDTEDWFAQDRDGNVWYLGEAVQNIEHGEVVDTAGSWEAGVDGARPGIAMPADPTTRRAYRQEFLAGKAEDLAEIVGTGARQAVPFGSYDHVVTIREWTPLEADVIEEKQYAPGVGQLTETDVAGGVGSTALVEFTPGR